MRKRLAGIGGLALLAGCSVGNDLPRADAGVADFHRELNAGQFQAIYNNASADMKGASTPDSMVKLFDAIHRKLGGFQSGARASWNDTINTSGHFVTINYSATYTAGPADENFVFRIEGDRALLAGYHINSMALIVN